MLGNDPGFTQYGHKRRVAIPAWNKVKVQVIPDSGSGGLPQIEADVDPLWVEMFSENGSAAFEKFHNLKGFFCCQ